MVKYQSHLKANELEVLRTKAQSLDKQADDISSRLAKGGVSAQRGWLCCLNTVLYNVNHTLAR